MQFFIVSAILLSLARTRDPTCGSGCSVCSSDQAVCYVCRLSSDQIINDGTCRRLLTTTPHCILYSPQEGCLRCSLTYYLTDGKCVKDSLGCLARGTSGCLQCGFGTVLYGGTCRGILNCLTYYSLGNNIYSCSKCAQGFANTLGLTCYVLTGCQSALSNGGCVECSEGYYLSGYSCVNGTISLTGCSIVGVDLKCLYCLEGFTLKGGLCMLLQNAVIDNTTSEPLPTVSTTISTTTTTVTIINKLSNCLVRDSTGTKCITCDATTSLDESGSCRPIPLNCQQFDTNKNQCEACVSGYSLNQGACVAVQFADPNCRTYVNNKCVACENRYFLNTTCSKINDLCLSVNANFLCTNCTTGYMVSLSGDCMDVNCNRSSNYQCEVCIKAYQLNAQANKCEKITIEGCNSAEANNCTECQEQLVRFEGRCFQLIVGCREYDITTKLCRLCFDSYVLAANSSSCVPANCQTWVKQQCTACIEGYYLNGTACQAIPVQHCKLYNNGCQTCHDGYTLSSRLCLKVVPPANCFNFIDGACKECQLNFTLVKGLCVLAPVPVVVPLVVATPVQVVVPTPPPNLFLSNKCASYYPNGSCSSCVAGYSLVQGQCQNTTNILIPNVTPINLLVTDPNCRIYSLKGVCVECVDHYYIKDLRCIEVNPLCLTYSPLNGQCLSCYPNYQLTQSSCLKLPPKLCATTDPTSSYCLSCYIGYQLTPTNSCVPASNPNCRLLTTNGCQECSKGYFLKNGQCQIISSLCATYNPSTGECTSCYQGYQFKAGNCSISSQPSFCRRYEKNICVECSQSYYRTSEGLCLPQNPQCRTVDPQNGSICTSCYGGYDLQNGGCVVPRNADPYCDQRAGQLCLHCRNGYWLDNGRCTAVNPNCRTYEQGTGQCLSCNNDFLLLNGDCRPYPKPNDRNCMQVNSQLDCLACTEGFYVKEGRCQTISILCLQFDKALGKCSQCQPGYFLQDGDCIYPAMGFDPYCTHYRSSFCDQCQHGYYLSSWVCFRVDPACTDFDATTATCRSCRVGRPMGAVCAS